jgi:hypothetical protein
VADILEAALRRIIRDEIRAALAESQMARPAAANDDEELVTMDDAAARAGFKAATLRGWAREGRLRVEGSGRGMRTTRAWLREAMAQKRTEPATPEDAARKLLGAG